ncbi:MAG: ribosome maturation factor RimM [Tenuifilaceae bacterium]|nr:ribosome maturation factor RimM [Tenuifilaceae bacterium]
MVNHPHLTEIGKIQRTHGVNGELQVSGLNDFLSENHTLESVFLSIEGIPIPFFIASIRPKGTNLVLLTFEDITTLKLAQELVGHKILAEVTSKQPPEELSLDNLIGFTIVSRLGVQLGTIAALQDYSGNLIFEVSNPTNNELLIPASPDLIMEIDEESKTIIMDVPEGITNL